MEFSKKSEHVDSNDLFSNAVQAETKRLQGIDNRHSPILEKRNVEEAHDKKCGVSRLLAQVIKTEIEHTLETKRMVKAEELEEKLLRFKAGLAQEFGESESLEERVLRIAKSVIQERSKEDNLD